MKKLCCKKAFTLIEIILSIAIFAAIALPLFSVFVQSIKTDRKAYDVLSANYIAQGYLEKLDASTYVEALTDKPSGRESDGYYLTASIRPYGTVSSQFDGKCGYVHLIMNDDGSMLSVMPDGKWHVFSSVPSSISIAISGGSYSFTGGYTTITGSLDYGYCAVLVNAMNKPSTSTTAITLGSNCKAVHYCRTLHESDITFTGSYETFKNMIEGKTSLIHVIASVYDSKSELVASSTGYINIKNW